MRTVIALRSGICFLTPSPGAMAWNKSGHLSSAAVAYGDLQDRNRAYAHPDWHYVNIPFRKWATKIFISEEDSILKAFSENRGNAKPAEADNGARAVALCSMFQLIGDVHRPL